MYLYLEEKTWVFLYLSFKFSPTLDTPSKVEWFIYQLFHCLLLWMLGHGSPFYMRWIAPGLGSGGVHDLRHECSFTQGVLDLLHFGNSFLIFCIGVNFELLGGVTDYLDSELFPNTWRRGVIPEHLDSEWTLRIQTRNDPEYLDPRWSQSDLEHLISEWSPSTWILSVPELRLTLPKCFTVLICNDSWPGDLRTRWVVAN